MRKKVIAVQFFIFWIITSVAYSQNVANPIEILLNFKNEGIKLKQSFYEDNQLNKYQFEIASNSSIVATGDNIFYQLKNKKSKKTKSKDIIEFFSHIDEELSKSNYVNVFRNEQNRVITYRKINNYGVSYLEVYYEDEQLSLIELTQMEEYGTDELKNIDSIYKINSNKIDFKENGLDRDKFQSLITKSKKLKLTPKTMIVAIEDSLIENYNIEFIAGKLTFENSSIQLMQSLANTIKQNTKSKFIVAGNTSSSGTENANYILSKQRAEFICKVLIVYFDIDQEQLRFKGNGENYPLFDNDTEIKRTLNRRIDLINYKPE